MAQLRPELPQIERRDARLVVVGNGAPHFARAFAEEFDLQRPGVTLYTDPSLRSYQAAALERSPWRMLDPRQLVALAGALRRGARQKRTQGDAAQLGGTFVIRPSGEIAYRHVSRFAGDFPAAHDVAAAI